MNPIWTLLPKSRWRFMNECVECPWHLCIFFFREHKVWHAMISFSLNLFDYWFSIFACLIGFQMDEKNMTKIYLTACFWKIWRKLILRLAFVNIFLNDNEFCFQLSIDFNWDICITYFIFVELVELHGLNQWIKV